MNPKKLIQYLFKTALVLFVALIGVSLLSTSGYAQNKKEEGEKKKREIAERVRSPKKETAPNKSAEKKEDSNGTVINVKNADISALVRIFSEKTKRNFILDERVKGKVSLFLPQEISAEESLKILDTVLALKGFTTVPVGENLWKIIPSKEAIQSTIPTLMDDSENGNASASVVTRLVHLNHINADDAKQILTPLISSTGLINAYTGTNSLIVIDSEDNIERVLQLVENLDVASRGREMTIIPVKFADATEIANKLQEILGDKDTPQAGSNDPRTAALNSIRARLRESRSTNANTTNASNNSSGSAAANTTSATVSARSLEPKIIPDERTNSVIVIADDETTARIRALISQLDSEVNKSGFRFYVYRCQHASAEDLAEVLSGLAGEGGSNLSSTRDRNNPLGLNRNSRERGGQFSRTQDRLGSQSRTPGRSRSENSAGSVGSTSVSFGEDLSITSDPATNSLIIYSSKAEYEKLMALLEDLDVKPRQVLVEAMILEVDVTDLQAEGTSFITSGGGADGGVFAQSTFGGNIASLLQDPTGLSNFTVAAASAGVLSLPGGIDIPAQTVLLNALQNNTRANVLSAPNILATDNQQAEIVVGENVPFIASTSTSGDNLNNTFNTVDRQDVGITLRITPQISSNDTVRLDIFTEVSNVADASADSELGPTTSLKTSETTAITKSDQMVVIGGLMSDEVNEVDTGVPYLMDVPVLGYLFRSSRINTQRKNLLIFITPRIIRDQFDHRELTMVHRDEVKHTIEKREIHPHRDEVLSNPDINNVMKAEKFKGTPPSTIRGSRSNSLPSPIIEKGIGDSGEVARFKARPPLPTSGRDEVSSSVTTPVTPSVAVALDSGRKGGNTQFILAKIIEPPKNGYKAPFLSDSGSKGQLVGLRIPPSAGHVARSMVPGSRFRYGPRESAPLIEVSSVYFSSDEAIAASSGGSFSGSWYMLSPFEIMNFGKGPWHSG